MNFQQFGPEQAVMQEQKSNVNREVEVAKKSQFQLKYSLLRESSPYHQCDYPLTLSPIPLL